MVPRRCYAPRFRGENLENVENHVRSPGQLGVVSYLGKSILGLATERGITQKKKSRGPRKREAHFLLEEDYSGNHASRSMHFPWTLQPLEGI